MLPTLYHYFRSSSSWRVRWALAHKGIECRFVAVNLLAGEQQSPEHLRRNPMGMVPVLQIDGTFLTESVAILEYLEETRPEPALLPKAPLARARVRQLVQVINADTQPIQNLSVLRAVSQDAETQKAWAVRFITRGFDAYESLLSSADWNKGSLSWGDELSMADLFLIPQCYNARRQGLDLRPWPRIAAIEAAALATPSGQASAPDRHRPPNPSAVSTP